MDLRRFLLVALITLAWPGLSAADTLLEEAFDAYQDGDLVGQGSWTGAPDSWFVTDADECGAGKCIISNGQFLNVSVPVLGLPEVEVRFRIRMPSAASDGPLDILLSAQGGEGTVRFSKIGDELTVTDTIGTTLFAGLSLDAWHDVAIERFRPEDGCKLRVSIDGSAIVEGVYADPQICVLYTLDLTGAPIDALTLHNELNQPVYIDDIKVSSTGASEPAVPDPVIIIPGILGSEKNSDGEWVIDPILHTYDDLIATLDANHYTPGQDLFTFPYDWHKSNVDTAVLLKQKIDEVKGICGCDKVDLVAHSMGGLVARQYIQSDAYEDDVDQLIFLGTPHLGAPKAYLMWEGGEVDPVGVENFVLQRILDQEAHENGYADLFSYIRNNPIPAVQELLPTYDYLFEGVNLRDYPTNYPANAFLENLNDDVANFLNSGVQIHNFVGNIEDADTIAAINVTDSHSFSPLWEHGYPVGFYEGEDNSGLERGTGDSTVPTASASFIQSDLTNLASNHNSLPEDYQARIYETLTAAEAETLVDNVNLANIRLILIKMFSPADLLIIAPDGKKIGKENGGSVNQIPGAFYTGFNTDTEFITIPNPLDGEYTIVTEGTGSGSYTIETDYITDATTTSAAYTGTMEPGQVSELVLAVDASEPEALEITGPDTEVPVITIASPLPGDYARSEAMDINVTAEDASGIASLVTLLGTTTIPNEGQLDLFFLKLGAHTLSVSATDMVGNATSSSRAFRVIATATSTVADFERAYQEGWMTEEVHDKLAKKVKAIVVVKKGVITLIEKKLKRKAEKLEQVLDKAAARAILKELDKYRGRGLDERGYQLLKDDILWLINN